MTDWTKPFDLTGQRILLVGAAGGMGRATARICASLGATMVLADIVDASDLVQQLAGAERGHTFQRCDGRDRSAVEALVGGLESLDTLVVCSGYYPPEDWQSDDWASALHEVVDANLVGPMNFTRAALGVMKPRGKGRIILVGSIAAHTGGSHVNSPIHYAGAKAAIHTTVSTVVSYVVLVPALDALMGSMPGEGFGGFMGSSMKFFLVIGLVIGLIWPILVGVLMSRPDARDACVH